MDPAILLGSFVARLLSLTVVAGIVGGFIGSARALALSFIIGVPVALVILAETVRPRDVSREALLTTPVAWGAAVALGLLIRRLRKRSKVA